MTGELRTIAAGLRFLEAPRRHADRIWFTDIYDRTIYSAAEDGSDQRIAAQTLGYPCGIDFDHAGRLLIVLMQERDAEDLRYPNGIAITDDSTLLVAESFGNRISSFCIQADGSLTSPGTFVHFGSEPDTSVVSEALSDLDVTPDGCWLDAENGLWVADAIHNRVLRVTGRVGITNTVTVDDGVFACMLGGSDGRTLYLCVAPDSNPSARLSTRESRFVAVTVEFPRAGRP